MEPNYELPYEQYYKPTNKFAVASMILGICSLIFLCTIFLPLFLGALGLIFAMLSKRRGQKTESPAVTGIITSSMGMGISLIICIVSVVFTSMMMRPENREQLDALYEKNLGMSYEEFIAEIYGEDMLEMLDSFY